MHIRIGRRPLLRRSNPRLLFLAVVTVLTGCAVGPDFTPPPAPNVGSLTPHPLRTPGTAAGETQRFAHGLDIPGAWWVLFHSRPLNDLVERALRDNNDLQTAQAALRAANAAVEAQRGFFYPTIGAGYNGVPQKAASSVLVPSTPTTAPFFTLQTATLAVSYAPDVFGGNRRTVETLEAQAEAQRFMLEATYLTLTSNIAVGAVQEASLRAQIAATHRVIDIEKELLELTRRQFNAGQIGRIDLATQEAALAQAEQTLPPLEKQLAIQRDLLTALSGHFAGEGLPERFEFASMWLPHELPVGLPSQLVQQRPDVRAAEANFHASVAHVGVAIAARLPQFNLTGTNVGRQSFAFNDLFACDVLVALDPAPCTFWTLAGNVTQVVFDGFTLEQQQRAAEAGLDQAAAQYRSTVVGAFQNVADALQALESDARALRAAVASVRAAKISLDLTRQQLERGQVSALQVLTVENTYLQALLSEIQAKTNRYADTVALFQALGGGWWNRSDVEADRYGDWRTRIEAAVSEVSARLVESGSQSQ